MHQLKFKREPKICHQETMANEEEAIELLDLSNILGAFLIKQ